MKFRRIFLALTAIFSSISLIRNASMNTFDSANAAGSSESNSSQQTMTEDDKLVIPSNIDFEIKMLELGVRFGDCTLIKYRGQTILIDAGGNAESGAKINAELAAITTIDYMIFTHADDDHIHNFYSQYGLPLWFERKETVVKNFIDFDMKNKQRLFVTDAGLAANYVSFVTQRQNLIKDHKILNYMNAAQCIAGGPATSYFPLDEKGSGLRILNNYFYTHDMYPQSITGADKNLLSVCVLINILDKKFLFTGDLEEFDSAKSSGFESEEEFGKDYGRIYGESLLATLNYEYLKDGVDFFKAGHHGSYTSNSRYLLDLIRPKYIGISAAITSYNTKIKPSFPGQISLLNMVRWTDYIYVTDKYDVEASNGIKSEISMYYGDIYYWILQTGEVVFTATNIKKYDKCGAFDSLMLERRKENIFIYNLCEDEEYGMGLFYSQNFSGKDFPTTLPFDKMIVRLKSLLPTPSTPRNTKATNATYIKIGHIDILINFGSRNPNSNPTNNVKKVNRLCNDNVLDYFVLSNYCIESYSHLLGSNGLLKNATFTVNNFFHFGRENMNFSRIQDQHIKDIINNPIFKHTYNSDDLNNKQFIIHQNNDDFSAYFNFLNMPTTNSTYHVGNTTDGTFSLLFLIEIRCHTSQIFKYCNIGNCFDPVLLKTIYDSNKDKLTSVDVFDLMSHGYINDSKTKTIHIFNKFYQDIGLPRFLYNGTLFADNVNFCSKVYKEPTIFTTQKYVEYANTYVAGNIITRFVFGADNKGSNGRRAIYGTFDIDYLATKVTEEISFGVKKSFYFRVGKCYNYDRY